MANDPPDRQPFHEQIPPELIREVLEKQGAFTWRPRGGSMMPVIRHREKILIEPHEAADARPGEILFFATAWNRLLVHRFLGWKEAPDGSRQLWTKGDTLPAADPLNPPETLLGRATATWRRGEKLPLVYSPADRLIAVASRLSAAVAAPLIMLSRTIPGGSNRWVQQGIRIITCGPVFLLGGLRLWAGGRNPESRKNDEAQN